MQPMAFGWNGAEPPFWVRAQKAISILDYREATKRCAISAAKLANGRPIYILYSGGIDSEVQCLGFMDAGIPFTAITCRFTNFPNDHDTVYADRFCQQFNLPQEYIYLDTRTLNDSLPPSDGLFDVTIQVLIYWLALQVKARGGLTICSQGSTGAARVYFNPELGNWCGSFRDGDYRLKDLLGEHYENFTSADLLLANIGDDIARAGYRQCLTGHTMTELRKKTRFKFYPEVKDRLKMHGWEKSRGIQATCIPQLDHYRRTYKLEYEQLLKDLDPRIE
jgi:hypothetical protein